MRRLCEKAIELWEPKLIFHPFPFCLFFPKHVNSVTPVSTLCDPHSRTRIPPAVHESQNELGPNPRGFWEWLSPSASQRQEGFHFLLRPASRPGGGVFGRVLLSKIHRPWRVTAAPLPASSSRVPGERPLNWSPRYDPVPSRFPVTSNLF
jgi:hypothetical protein